jgi:uncharacterized protein (TIRG00374 family)
MGAAAPPINAIAVGLAKPWPRTWLLKRSFGYLFALVGLLWVLYDVHPRQLLSAITITNWWFVAASVFFDVLTYVLQGVRWKLLLAPLGRLRSLRATQAVYAGLFANEIMPLRFGELVRAFLASRWIKSSVSAVVPSMVVERFLDGFWLALAIGLAAMFVPFPKNLLKAGDLLGAIVLVATVAFVWIVLRKKHNLEKWGHDGALKTGTVAALSSFVSRLAGGLRAIGMSRGVYGAAVISAGMLACQALAVWFVMLAYGQKLDLVAGIIVVLIVRLGTAIPNAPANVGSFQFFTVLALGLFGVEKTVAAGFSMVYFAVLTAPLWIVGFIALSNTDLRLCDIRAKLSG